MKTLEAVKRAAQKRCQAPVPALGLDLLPPSMRRGCIRTAGHEGPCRNEVLMWNRGEARTPWKQAIMSVSRGPARTVRRQQVWRSGVDWFPRLPPR
jgi:hypothetical protein